MRSWGPVLCSLLLTLPFGHTLFAAPTILGPLQDLREPIGPFLGEAITKMTTCTGPRHMRGPDQITVNGPMGSSVNALGVMFIAADNPDFTGPVTITTFYGMDVAPGSPDLSMTGFNPVSPELFPVSGETIFGDSGTPYLSSSDYGAVPLSALPGLFPELDLSLMQGDPSSVVFPFRTLVPGADITIVPEPTVAGMLLCTLGALAVAARRPSN